MAAPTTAITCDSPEDCAPGDVCCAHRYANNAAYPYMSVACQSACNAPEAIVCDPTGPNICASPMICKASQILPSGYFVCGSP